MKLTYWYATMKDDSAAYSIRARTKRECDERRDADGGDARYEPTKKAVVEYADGFELMADCLGEGRGCWED